MGVVKAAGWAGLAAGWFAAWWAEAQRAGGFSLLLLFFVLVFPFPFFLYFPFFYFFSFSVFTYFKILRHFIKLCLLHHIDLCKIWHLPNIFVLNFEKLLLFAYILNLNLNRFELTRVYQQ